ncbi:MAG: hypothetical protein GX552_03605 [Chloroflexi bacterium]|nr:hypothetical protein [Chloroflexota bacterium]
MSDKRALQSIIAADIGSTLTHVSLLELVEGTYRFVAHAETPSTITEPDMDLMVGLVRAIKRLEYITQRAFLDEAGELIQPVQAMGDGVDAFVATSSAAPPLRCILVGLTNDLSIESARRGCAAANVLVTDTVILDRGTRRWDNRTLNRLHAAPPDLLLLVGGVDNGPVAPLENAAHVLSAVYEALRRERRPVVIFAGNQEARRPVSDIMSPAFDFRVVDNVRPTVRTESLAELQRELADVYERVKLATLPGFRLLRRWCTAPVRSTAEAFGNMLRYFARRNELAQGVLGVDAGGMTTYVGAACGEQYHWAVTAESGSSYGTQRVLELAGADRVRRWLPMSLTNDETVTRLENVQLRPRGIPQTMDDLLLTHAVLREAVSTSIQTMRHSWELPGVDHEGETLPAFDVIAARGGSIVHTPEDGMMVLTVLDALQPTGLTRLVVDWASLWPQLGAIAGIAPLVAAQVLERDSFRELGTVISPVGVARDGDRALDLKIIPEHGKVIEARIPAGTVQCFPLPLEDHAVVEVRPSRDFDIGLGRKGMGGRAKVRGGSLGIIVDTRGRPLALPQNERQRMIKIQQWLGNLVGDVDWTS